MQGLVNSLRSVQFGLNGFDELTGTESGDWVAVKAINGDAILSATCSPGDNLSSTTLSEGDVIYAPFSQIVVTSGRVLAHRK
jgi:hypothetical protein